MRAINPERELRELFQGLVEQVFFTEVGICAPAVTDYLSGLLADFVHVDRIYRMRSVDGRTIRELSRLQADADLGPATAEDYRTLVINRYVGDLTLFWTGMYPETLRRRFQGGIDRLHEYTLQGKRGYEIASALTRPGQVPPADLLRGLSEQFESCMHGLALVRRTWERHSRHVGHN